MEIRRLVLDDLPASYRLSVEAFGSHPGGPPPTPTALPEGREVWLAVDDDGAFVARAAAHSYASWWHGRRVPTAGVASVTVAAERRGEGLLRPVFAALLAAAAERGEVLSTLYPTANGIYRPMGYEVVTSFDTVRLATAELAAVRAPAATRTRRARAEDLPAVHEVYAAWAAAQNGPLTRTGPRFAQTPEEQLADVTAISLAVEDGADGERVVGFAAWDRGEGYDPATAALEVHDLVALTADGYRALWRLFGSHTSVAGTVRLHTSGHDPARQLLPTSTWQVESRHPYALRVSDPAGALTAAGPAVPGLVAEVPFGVTGDPVGGADGSYRLLLGDGPGTCERTSVTGGPTFTPQGLALAYAGVQSCANLRMLGLLTGPDEHDRVLDAALGGRPAHVRDYF
ncbi:GNAT family N-acetyltransferase [Nocardioides litoris]|uniref:GNAT family N-acetyltransferase n=1 Tax=Nocardioides litoris TaxID=1926648 RepID=UPI0014775C39|nr:GNAT family N-acetyltransferase [Nocardioides litoris]